MRAVTAGCVVTRDGAEGVEVLLVHARGATFRRPLFGIPKGLVEDGENLQQAAQREVMEETGLEVEIHTSLGRIKQKSGKIVYAFWATVAEASMTRIDEKGRCATPDEENDVCRFYPLAQAPDLMIPAQVELLDRLREVIGSAAG